MKLSIEKNEQQNQGHIFELDGLKGVAILIIMLRHFYNEELMLTGHPILGPVITKLAIAGNYGVEIFFVLSGFLATQTLLKSKNESKYYIKFYTRRILRICPLYYGTLILIFYILPLIVTFDAAAKDISSRQIWLWIFLSNLPWSGGGWDSSNIFKLGHLWFLCVVVHFYIIWPIIIYKLKNQNVINICLAGLASCLLLRSFYTITGWPLLFTWTTITKFDGLLFGALLAVGIKLDNNRIMQKYLSEITLLSGIIFFCLIFIPREMMSDHTQFWWVPTETISVIFIGCMLIHILKKKNILLQKLTNNKLLITFGKYSYGLFIIHNIFLPLFKWLFKPEELSTIMNAPIFAQIIYYIFSIAVSFIFAFASWHLFEKHFIRIYKTS